MTFLNTRKFFLLFTFIFDNEVTYNISLLDELTSFQSCLTLCKLLNVQLGDLVHAADRVITSFPTPTLVIIQRC